MHEVQKTVIAVDLSRQDGLYSRYFKRPLDIILCLGALFVLSPVLLIVAYLVRIKLGSPVLFKQKRPGLDEKIFTMYKFRTMTDERDERGQLLPDEVRLTKLGKILRSTSLDELPELFNILLGEMSIIGPRPLLVKDLVFMSREQRLRHSILPGLTGLAQVNGRNSILWEDKFRYDKEYMLNITLFADIRIFLFTFISVFRREGIGSGHMETGEDFGNYLLREQKISRCEYDIAIRKSEEMLKDSQ